MRYSYNKNSKDSNKQWVEDHILKNSDFVFYGILYNELHRISPVVFWEEIRKIAESYLSIKTNRTAIFHKLIDDELDRLINEEVNQGYPAPYCHKGCCNCCHEPVLCTDEEAVEIKTFCKENNINIDEQKIMRQLAHLTVDDFQNLTGKTNWNDQPEEDQSCVFLDPHHKFCRIWKVRPFVCRVHLAENTDQYCRPHNGEPNVNAAAINYLEWSYVLTTIFTIHNDSIKKSMGRLLLNN